MENNLIEEQKIFPIWLVGDSYPSGFVSKLNHPLDPRHPTRHTIWTPIWDAIQETVYPLRVDGQHLFICNAAEKQVTGEPNKNFDDDVVKMRIVKFSDYLVRYKPAMVLCFGAWAYEFVLRASASKATERSDRYWTVERLAKAFRESCERFQPNSISIFPLLHQSVALKWEHTNNKFVLNDSGNDYFKYTGSELGKLLTTHKDNLKVIWKPIP